MATDLHNLDPGVPGLAALGVSLHLLSTLTVKGILSEAELQDILKGALKRLARPEQREAAADMIRAVMPNVSL